MEVMIFRASMCLFRPSRKLHVNQNLDVAYLLTIVWFYERFVETKFDCYCVIVACVIIKDLLFLFAIYRCKLCNTDMTRQILSIMLICLIFLFPAKIILHSLLQKILRLIVVEYFKKEFCAQRLAIES